MRNGRELPDPDHGQWWDIRSSPFKISNKIKKLPLLRVVLMIPSHSVRPEEEMKYERLEREKLSNSPADGGLSGGAQRGCGGLDGVEGIHALA